MNADGFMPIFADVEDFVVGLVVLLFMAIGALMQWLNKARDAQQRQRRGPAARPERVRENAAPARDNVRAELDDFLRDAARRRGAGQAQQLGPRPAAPARQSPVAAQRQPVQEVVDVEPVEAAPEDAGVADHVRRHLGTHEFGALPSDVGKRLSQTEKVLEEHLHSVFDHRLTALGDVLGESAQVTQPEEGLVPEDRITPVPATAAAGLAAMFADPGNLRRAIVINEILQRPEHRW